MAELRGSSVRGFFFGVRRILLLILTFILAFRVFSLLSLTTALVGIFRNFQGSRRDLVRLWLRRYLCGLFRVRGVRTWELANFWIVVNALRSPQVRAHRDPCSIKGFTLRDVAITPAYSGEFLCKSSLSLLHPKRISSLLLGLGCLLNQLDSFSGLLKLFAKLRHQLLFCRQIDFIVVQLFT